MKQVLRAIPLSVEITMLDTDMQGYDYTAVSSVIEEIRARPIRYLKTETHIRNIQGGYKNVDNDLCRLWLPLMTKTGYRMISHSVGGQLNLVEGYTTTEEAVESCRTEKYAGYSEIDALWVLNDGAEVPPDAFDYRPHHGLQPPFSAAEYES